MASPLENAVQFLKDFGFFDVVLPFLFIFALVFAVLEKTKIFGTVKEGDEQKPLQRVNAMIAFVIALFFVAVPSLVQTIKISLPQIALLLIVIVTFLMLIGSLATGANPLDLTADSYKWWKRFLYLIILLSVSAIFLNSFGWLDPILDYIVDEWQDTFIVSMVFLIIIVTSILYIVGKGEGKKE
ncbi:MAG: hypothetical protein AABW49_03915 [Nanoarchaeota archaeon]